jgi:prevent-host-death family protein
MHPQSKLPDTVTAKEFQRHPGRYKRLAQSRPLTITDNGEPSLVLMSVAEYERLMRRDRKALRASELDEETLAAIEAYEPDPADYAFEHETDGAKS